MPGPVLMQQHKKLSYDLYLTGGGLKGAYQYGFFRKLYSKYPDMLPNRVFGASVGAVNALPILLGRPQELKKYWQNEYGKHPFDCIMNAHDECMLSSHGDYSLLSNMYRVATAKSMFESIRREPFEDIWKSLSLSELSHVQKRLNIVVFDSLKNAPAYLSGFESPAEYTDAIVASTLYPGLVNFASNNTSSNNTMMDGIMCDHQDVVAHIVNTRAHDDTCVLILDIHEEETPKHDYLYDKSVIVVSPYQCIAGGKLVSFCASRRDVDKLVANGEEHADMFCNKFF
jgi:Patatin-like phospholipase